MRDDGILTGPIEDPGPNRRRSGPRPLAVTPGLVLEHRGSGTTGTVISFSAATTVLRDRLGRDHTFRTRDGDFLWEGEPIAPRPAPAAARGKPMRTASGSIDLGPVPARMARAGRIFVEGIHDAELVEKVWGDDLRVEGVVVERMDGMDDLAAVVRRFGPGPDRRLGILLDHLVEGTKERRAASSVDHPDVLITGHPYIDVWQAVKPRLIGLEAWPEVPRGVPWKDGVCAALGWRGSTGAFWTSLLARVTSYRDLEPGLVGAVEQLVDFVAPPGRD